MKYFSMFSGIGGFEYGIQCAFNQQFAKVKQDRQRGDRNANEMEHNVLPTSRKSSLCVGYSEIDKYAIKVYERHFGGHKNYGDATKINPKELPNFDLLVGGFPCQAFSIAGKRKGFDDTRGTLFFDIARILAEKKPKHLVLENVKGLLSHDQGRTFQTILGILADLGYRVEWQVLNSKDFGVPQNRERIIIVGHLGECCGRKVFPIRYSNTKNNETSKQGDYTRTITTAHSHGTATNMSYIKQINKPKHSNDRVYSEDGISPTLNTMQGGNRQPFINYTINSNKKDFRVFDDKGVAPSLQARSDTHKLGNNTRIRRLTPKECERLQGFPDDWTKYGINDEPISDTQRYKMCGNAVTTNVITAVMEKLL